MNHAIARYYCSLCINWRHQTCVYLSVSVSSVVVPILHAKQPQRMRSEHMTAANKQTNEAMVTPAHFSRMLSPQAIVRPNLFNPNPP